MNIGIDARNTGKTKTGIGIYIEKIVEELNRADKENNYYLYSDGKIDFDFKLNSNFKTRENIGGKLKFYFALPKMMIEDKLDIYWGTHYILPKRPKLNIRFVLTIHDLAINKLKTVGAVKTTLVQKLLWKKSIKRADDIIAVSNTTKNDIIEIYKVPEEKVHAIYSGTNFDNEEKVLSEKSKSEIEEKYKIKDTPFIFFISTIEPRKNIETLIRAFNYIRRREDTNLKLIIAGGFGWKYDEVLRLFETSEYKEDIIMPGYISKEEKKYLYENAKAFIYPSLYEGFGLPILEAMANRALVVTANNSSLPEVGGDAAFYYDNVLNYSELGNKIVEVINLSEDEKKKHIEQGEKQAKKFTWEKCANQTKKILFG